VLLRKENRYAVVTSERKRVSPAGKNRKKSKFGNHNLDMANLRLALEQGYAIAGRKCQALAFYFPYEFALCSQKAESDLGLYMISVLANRMRLHNADFRFENVLIHKMCQNSILRSAILVAEC